MSEFEESMLRGAVDIFCVVSTSHRMEVICSSSLYDASSTFKSR